MNAMTEITESPTAELLTFRVGGEDYAIDISTTREIRGWMTPSPMPDSPEFVVGLINLRGTLLPLLDLAGRLGLPAPKTDDRSVILVAEVAQTQVGLIVDAVSDIIAPSADDMQPPPEAASNTDQPYVQSLTLVGDRMVRILDLSFLVSAPKGIAEQCLSEE